MQLDGSLQTTAFSRTAANELAKGYYPTHPVDVAHIAKALDPNFGWVNRGAGLRVLSVFDPCAGEGDFLGTVKRHLQKLCRQMTDKPPVDIVSLAVELDQERFTKIRGACQKVQSSFFDVRVDGRVSITLLNPPYNRQDGEMLTWLQQAASVTSHQGIVVFLLPEYELHRPDMQAYLDGNFDFIHVFRSEYYKKFKQVVVFLSKGINNRLMTKAYSYGLPKSNFDSRDYPSFLTGQPFQIRFFVPEHPVKPLLSARDLEPVYQSCEAMLAHMTGRVLTRAYPQAYDTSLRPLATLRTAHAVQLAAMNSQIESVRINGINYLAKYMVKETAESFTDPETETETIIYKPTVEAYLMDAQGRVHTAKELGFDYYELNSYLSGVLLTRLTREYRPLHKVGSDPDFLAEDLERIGLLPPQREAVKALIKGYRAGAKGLGLRGATGSGKTYMAKALVYLLKARRTVFVTEPHLVPQIAKEYANEDFAVHVIDSWDEMKRLSREKPAGLYLISYTRLRMHPKYALSVSKKKVLVGKGGEMTHEYRTICQNCWRPIDLKLRKSDKENCPHCDSPLFTYLPENNRGPLSYRDWIRQVESGTIRHRYSENKQLPYIRLLKKIHFDFACFDEAHNAGNHLSNQGSAFIRLAATARKVLACTATVGNGLAKSFFNILWGLVPEQMAADGWERSSVVEFQAQYGAFREVRKSDENNRHRGAERVATYDTAGVSPAILRYTLPSFVNVDSSDFTDLPPVSREVIRCKMHPKAEEALREVETILGKAAENMDMKERRPLVSVRNAAYLRLPDTFCHAHDELMLRDLSLGTVCCRSIPEELLEKEEHLVRIVLGARQRGERVLVYTGHTQKVDVRPVLKRILQKHTVASIDVLPDSVPAQRVVPWFEKTTADVVIAGFKRCGTGMNLSQFPNIVWYDYTSNTRAAEQGDGRNRRVNTADLHRRLFGDIRTCRYYYLVCGPAQEMELSYTLEKRMVAKLAEGETPDIDPAECSAGEQSFSALLTRALRTGQFNYKDPSELLRAMTRQENARIRPENLAGRPTATEEIFEPVVEEAPEPVQIRPAKMEQLDLFGEWASAA